MNHNEMLDSSSRSYVWDPLVRFSHWGLVVAFAIAYVSAEDALPLHVWSGYAIGGLVLIRLVWGLIGTKHARFSDFIYQPTYVVDYLRSLSLMKAKRFLGHSPAGGAMVILLLISLAATVVSGIAVYGVREGAGPLAGFALPLTSHSLRGLHEFFASLTVTLVVVHVAGVLFASFAHRENLISAMLTGYKRS